MRLNKYICSGTTHDTDPRENISSSTCATSIAHSRDPFVDHLAVFRKVSILQAFIQPLASWDEHTWQGQCRFHCSISGLLTASCKSLRYLKSQIFIHTSQMHEKSLPWEGHGTKPPSRICRMLGTLNDTSLALPRVADRMKGVGHTSELRTED